MQRRNESIIRTTSFRFPFSNLVLHLENLRRSNNRIFARDSFTSGGFVVVATGMSIGVTVFGAEHFSATATESDQSDFSLATRAPIHHAPLRIDARVVAQRLNRLRSAFFR
ncbi:hypothetical protein Hanom_Chr07g00658441 [Helianthus anomalus]